TDPTSTLILPASSSLLSLIAGEDKISVTTGLISDRQALGKVTLVASFLLLCYSLLRNGSFISPHCRWNLGALSCSNQARVVCPLVCAISPHHAE
ncbi:unnamed protein product, partial [Menidia menidia]